MFFGGDGGNRTRVRKISIKKHCRREIYIRFNILGLLQVLLSGNFK